MALTIYTTPNSQYSILNRTHKQKSPSFTNMIPLSAASELNSPIFFVSPILVPFPIDSDHPQLRCPRTEGRPFAARHLHEAFLD